MRLVTPKRPGETLFLRVVAVFHHVSLHARRWPDTPDRRSNEGCSMLDVIMLAIGLGFFVLTVGYAYGCERL